MRGGEEVTDCPQSHAVVDEEDMSRDLDRQFETLIRAIHLNKDVPLVVAIASVSPGQHPGALELLQQLGIDLSGLGTCD